MYIVLFVTTISFIVFQLLYSIVPLVYSKVKKLDPNLEEKSLSVLVNRETFIQKVSIY